LELTEELEEILEVPEIRVADPEIETVDVLEAGPVLDILDDPVDVLEGGRLLEDVIVMMRSVID